MLITCCKIKFTCQMIILACESFIRMIMGSASLSIYVVQFMIKCITMILEQKGRNIEDELVQIVTKVYGGMIIAVGILGVLAVSAGIINVYTQKQTFKYVFISLIGFALLIEYGVTIYIAIRFDAMLATLPLIESIHKYFSKWFIYAIAATYLFLVTLWRAMTVHSIIIKNQNLEKLIYPAVKNYSATHFTTNRYNDL
ncbi:hypothetical protein ACOME3_001988 [Neoechinorhynchus agilis]